MVVGHSFLVMGCLYIPQFLRDVKYSRNFLKGLIVNSMWDVQYLLLWNYDAVAMDHISCQVIRWKVFKLHTTRLKFGPKYLCSMNFEHLPSAVA